MEIISKSIVQMGIFMICSQVLIHFRPNGSYQKYLKLLVSSMLLIQLLSPVFQLINGQDFNVSDRVAQFEEKLTESAKKAASAALRTEEVLEKMTKDVVAQRKAQSELAESNQATAPSRTSKKMQDIDENKVGNKVEKIEKITVEIGD